AGFEVILRQNPRNAAEIAICIYMGRDPVFLPHVLECFHIGISAVWQNGNEQVFFDEFTGIRIDNMGGLARPVNLNNVSRLVFKVHGGLGFVNVVCVVLVELGGFVRQFADRPALFTVFGIQ